MHDPAHDMRRLITLCEAQIPTGVRFVVDPADQAYPRDRYSVIAGNEKIGTMRKVYRGVIGGNADFKVALRYNGRRLSKTYSHQTDMEQAVMAFIANPQQMKTVEVDGVRRPMHNNEGLLIAPTVDAQVAFWRWFGKSKIVDQHGRPIMVFRGDRPGKTEFTGRERDNYIQDNIFFTNRRSIAKGYTPHGRNPYLDPSNMDESHGFYTAYLKVEKPVVIDAKGAEWSRIPVSGRLNKAIGGWGGLQIDNLALHVQRNTKNDGLIVKDVMDQWGDGDQFVVFSSQQIKLA